MNTGRWRDLVLVIVGSVLLATALVCAAGFLGWEFFPRGSGPGALWSVITLVLAGLGIVTVLTGILLALRKPTVVERR